MRIANLSKTLRYRDHIEVSRITIRHFIPLERRRHARIRKRPHGVSRTRRAIFRVLVVIEKYTVSLFFPPLRARELRYSSLDLTRQRHCRASHFAERPARLDSHIHMHAARATRLGPTTQSHLSQRRLRFQGDESHTLPLHTWARIEIDTQLIRMIEIARTHRMRMMLDAAELDDPNKSRRIVDNDF